MEIKLTFREEGKSDSVFLFKEVEPLKFRMMAGKISAFKNSDIWGKRISEIIEGIVQNQVFIGLRPD